MISTFLLQNYKFCQDSKILQSQDNWPKKLKLGEIVVRLFLIIHILEQHFHQNQIKHIHVYMFSCNVLI